MPAGRYGLEWSELLPRLRGTTLRLRWIPSYLTEEEAAAAGVLREDWAGNSRADALAKAAAADALPEPEVVQARALALQRLALLQRAAAAAQLAAVRDAHAHRPMRAPPRKRQWPRTRRKMQAHAVPPPRKENVQSRHSKSQVVKAVAAVTRQPPAGPPPLPLHDLVRDGDFLACRRCPARVGPQRWPWMRKSMCRPTAAASAEPPARRGRGRGRARSAPPPAGTEVAAGHWQQVAHQTVAVDGALACVRCGGWVPHWRAATFQGRRCKAWAWTALPGGPGGGEDPDWGLWWHRAAGGYSAGAAHAAAAGPAPEPASRDGEERSMAAEAAGLRASGRDVSPAATPDRRGGPAALRWRPHVPAAEGRPQCTVCRRRARSVAGLLATACAVRT